MHASSLPGEAHALTERPGEGSGAHLEVSVNDPLLVAVLDRRHYLDRRDVTLIVIPGADL